MDIKLNLGYNNCKIILMCIEYIGKCYKNEDFTKQTSIAFISNQISFKIYGNK